MSLLHHSAHMARSKSGRMVVNLEKGMKDELYSALAGEGLTAKDWITREALKIVREKQIRAVEQPLTKKRLVDSNKEKPYEVVSMFSGCGGMDLGFKGGFSIFGKHYGKHPFQVTWANDLNQAACRSYELNLKHPIKCGNVWDLVDTLPHSADVVIGGFPCQDISINGKQAGVNGTRSGLYRAMLYAIDRCQPRIFVAENVKGLLHKSNTKSLVQVISDFKALGYKVSFKLYNAALYGVPQARERVFIVGTKSHRNDFIPPRETCDISNWLTAEDAVRDLENIPEHGVSNHVWSRAKKSPEQGSRVLKSNRPAQTMRAECHGNIQFHYKLNRRISMREAARFQSFPDDFIFDSKLRETERQIGNAVPPILAWHIAGAVKEFLHGETNEKA